MRAGDAARLRLAVAQTAPKLRDLEGNAGALASLHAESGADVLLTPELSLTGYDLRDAVHELAVPVRPGAGLTRGPAISRDATGQLIVGLAEAAPGGPYNTAAVIEGGVVVFRHRKVYLPTYGMFDEARWFGRGSSLDVWEPRPGWRAGLLVCEDFWHPGLVYVLASRGIDVLLVQAAAPGRDTVRGGENGAFGSADVWERLVRTTAQTYGMYVALANRVGVEGGVTFAGGSVVAGPDGAIVARADDRSPAVLEAVLDRAVLEAARRPWSHCRDDDPRLVLRELGRALEP